MLAGICKWDDFSSVYYECFSYNDGGGDNDGDGDDYCGGDVVGYATGHSYQGVSGFQRSIKLT